MRAYVEARRIVIEDVSAEESRTILNALKAAIEDYDRRSHELEGAARYCTAPPRNMRKRASELRDEARGMRALRDEAIRVAAILEPAVRDRGVV